MKKKRITIKFSIMIIVLVLVSSFIFSSCGSSGGNAPAEQYSAPAAGNPTDGFANPEEGVPTDPEDTSSPEVGTSERKRTYTTDLVIESQSFSETHAKINALIDSTKGSFVNLQELDNSLYLKSVHLVIKVPANLYKGFLDTIITNEEDYSLMSMTETVEDITAQYIDAQSRLIALEAQEKRILALMESSGSLTELLTIEKHLTEVQYQIVACKAALQTYSEMTSFSTVRITLSEVKEYTELPPETFGSRLLDATKESFDNAVSFLQGLVIAIIYLIPFLILMGAIAAIVLVCLHYYRKKNPKKVIPPAPAPPQWQSPPIPTNNFTVPRPLAPANAPTPVEPTPKSTPVGKDNKSKDDKSKK